MSNPQRSLALSRQPALSFILSSSDPPRPREAEGVLLSYLCAPNAPMKAASPRRIALLGSVKRARDRTGSLGRDTSSLSYLSL